MAPPRPSAAAAASTGAGRAKKEKAGVQLDRHSTAELNLTVLQRQDPGVEEILLTAGHVTLYGFDVRASAWSRKDVEGSLFVVKRREAPRFQFIVMNRKSSDNLVEDLLGGFEYEVQVPYLLYRNKKEEVNGIWFYSPKECQDVAKLFSRILQTFVRAPPKKLLPTAVAEAELEAVPSEDIIQGPLEPSGAVPALAPTPMPIGHGGPSLPPAQGPASLLTRPSAAPNAEPYNQMPGLALPAPTLARPYPPPAATPVSLPRAEPAFPAFGPPAGQGPAGAVRDVGQGHAGAWSKAGTHAQPPASAGATLLRLVSPGTSPVPPSAPSMAPAQVLLKPSFFEDDQGALSPKPLESAVPTPPPAPSGIARPEAGQPHYSSTYPMAMASAAEVTVRADPSAASQLLSTLLLGGAASGAVHPPPPALRPEEPGARGRVPASHGAPLLQPFPPPAPPSSLTASLPRANNEQRISVTRSGLKQALLGLLEDDTFLDRIFAAVAVQESRLQRP